MGLKWAGLSGQKAAVGVSRPAAGWQPARGWGQRAARGSRPACSPEPAVNSPGLHGGFAASLDHRLHMPQIPASSAQTPSVLPACSEPGQPLPGLSLSSLAPL